MAHGLALQMEEMFRTNQYASNDRAKLSQFQESTEMKRQLSEEMCTADSEIIKIINSWRQLLNNPKKNRTDFFSLIRRTLLFILSCHWERRKSSLKTQLCEAVAACHQTFIYTISRSKKICQNVIDVAQHPWQNKFFEWDALLQGKLTYEDKQVQQYLQSEVEEVVIARAHSLFLSGHQAVAMNLVMCSFKYYSRIATETPFCKIKRPRSDCSDMRTKSKDRRGYTTMEWFIFLLKRKKPHEIINHLKQLSCHEGVEVVNRLRKSPQTLPSAYSALQVFILKDLIYQSEYCCTKRLFIIWCEILKQMNIQPKEAVDFLAQHAPTSAHFYLFGDVLWEQFGSNCLSLHAELYIRGLTSDINHLEVMRNSDVPGDMEGLENHIASLFDKLSTLFSDSHEEVARECMFSAFSLKPTKHRLLVLQSLTHSLLSSDSHSIDDSSSKKDCSCGFKCSGTCIKFKGSSVFHPLLTKGIKNVKYYLVTDLVCVLESVRCINFQYNIFDWNKHSFELGDYLTLKCPQNVRGPMIKEWDSDSETEFASDYSGYENGTTLDETKSNYSLSRISDETRSNHSLPRISEEIRSNHSLPRIAESPTSMSLKRKSKNDHSVEMFCLDVGLNVEVESDDSTNKKLKIHISSSPKNQRETPVSPYNSNLSRPSFSSDTTIISSLLDSISTLKTQTKTATAKYQKEIQESSDAQNSNSSRPTSAFSSTFDIGSKIQNQRRGLEREKEEQLPSGTCHINFSPHRSALTSEGTIISALFDTESKQSSNHTVNSFSLIKHSKQDHCTIAEKSNSSFTLQSKVNSVNLKGNFIRDMSQPYRTTSDSQSNTMQNRNSVLVTSPLVKGSLPPVKGNSSVQMYRGPFASHLAESSIVKTIAIPKQEIVVHSNEQKSQFHNQEALNLSSKSIFSNVQQTQGASMYKSQTVKIQQTERVSFPGWPIKETSSATEIAQKSLTKNSLISYQNQLVSRVSNVPSYSQASKTSQQSGINIINTQQLGGINVNNQQSGINIASPSLQTTPRNDYSRTPVYKQKKINTNKSVKSSAVPSLSEGQRNQKTFFSSCDDGQLQQLLQRDRNSVILHTTQMQNSPEKNVMTTVQVQRNQVPITIPVSIDKTVVKIGDSQKVYTISLPSQNSKVRPIPANLVIPHNTQSNSNSSNSIQSEPQNLTLNQSDAQIIPGHVVPITAALSHKTTWSGRVKTHGKMEYRKKNFSEAIAAYKIPKINHPQEKDVNESSKTSRLKMVSDPRCQLPDQQKVFTNSFDQVNINAIRSTERMTIASVSNQPWYSAPFPKQAGTPIASKDRNQQQNHNITTYPAKYSNVHLCQNSYSTKTNYIPGSQSRLSQPNLTILANAITDSQNATLSQVNLTNIATGSQNIKLSQSNRTIPTKVIPDSKSIGLSHQNARIQSKVVPSSHDIRQPHQNLTIPTKAAYKSSSSVPNIHQNSPSSSNANYIPTISSQDIVQSRQHSQISPKTNYITNSSSQNVVQSHRNPLGTSKPAYMLSNSNNVVHLATHILNTSPISLNELSKNMNQNRSSNTDNTGLPSTSNAEKMADAYILKKRLLSKINSKDPRKAAILNSRASTTTFSDPANVMVPQVLQSKQNSTIMHNQCIATTSRNYNNQPVAPTQQIGESHKQPTFNPHVSSLTYPMPNVPVSSTASSQVKTCCSPLEVNPCDNCSVPDVSRNVREPVVEDRGLPGGGYTQANYMVNNNFPS